jgi:hypothetical protein
MRLIVVLADAERAAWLTCLLRARGHDVAHAVSLRAASLGALDGPPDCVVTEQALLGGPVVPGGRWGRPEWGDAPTFLVEPQHRWSRIVEEVESAGARPRMPGEADRCGRTTRGGVRLVVFDPRHLTGPLLDGRFRALGWEVTRVASLPSLARVVLGGRVACVVLAPAPDGGAATVVLRALSCIREAHPRPFAMVALVDREDAEVVKSGRRAGADHVVVRRTVADVAETVAEAIRAVAGTG